MTGAATLPPVEQFRRFLAARFALRFEEDKADLLSQVLQERAEARGAETPEAYLARLPGANGDELRALAERLTIGESYFFRNPHDMEAFTETALAERIRIRAAERRLRILSAGCSSGEEPYSLAMRVLDVPELAGWDVRIHAFDVNPAAVARAHAGRYSPWSLRQTAPALRNRFFRQEGREFRVLDEVKALVTIEERNLALDDPTFWNPGAFDVVFCRNVIMYLAPEAVPGIVGRIAASLSPGGFLFLGHAETLRGVSAGFHLRHSHGTFYYQLRGTEDEVAPTEDVGTARSQGWVAVEPPRGDTGWMDVIGSASRRIAQLSAADRSTSARAKGESQAPALGFRPGGMSLAHELLERERFLDALAALGPSAAEQEKDLDALLLRAVLLASSGDLGGAEGVCARVLRLDELNAEAHYLRAICREHAGDLGRAADHDRYAIYLDPTFAMPRLHLGLLAKRAGDVEQAQRELSRALSLFAAEDGSRVLLLGGGFTRDGLIALCRAELGGCGGLP